MHIADGRNLSTGTGILVLKAADFAAQGMDARTIAEKIEALAPKVETEFIVDTLDYLHKGGRCTGLTRLVGSMLKIRPSLKVIGGKLYPQPEVPGHQAKSSQRAAQYRPGRQR